MKRKLKTVLLLLGILALISCAEKSEVSKKNVETVVPNLTEEELNSLSFEEIIRRANRGFVDHYYNFDLATVFRGPPEVIPEDKLDFYNKYVGVYTKPENLGPGAPLNNLVNANFHWGNGLYFVGDFKAIVWMADQNKFYAPSGDSDGPEVSDFAEYKIPEDWVMFSSPNEPGTTIKRLLEEKAETLNALHIDRNLDETKKKQFEELCYSTIVKLHEGKLDELNSTKIDETLGPQDWKSFSFFLGPNIKRGYFIVYNGFQNEDAKRMKELFGDMIMFDFCPRNDSEYISLGFKKTENGYSLCYVKDGFSGI